MRHSSAIRSDAPILGRVGGWAGLALIAAVVGTEWLDVPAPTPDSDTRVAETVTDVTAAPFTLCRDGNGARCVVDGDTFRLDGERVRIADIDTPETHPARCAAEAALGEQATGRLMILLNAGPFTLSPVERDSDRYGRLLRIVARDGQSLGDRLVAEGLARPYAGGRRKGWCG